VVILVLQDDLHSGAAGGHLDEDKTLGWICERFYWPGFTEDVYKWHQQCPECTMRKTPASKPRGQLTNIYSGYRLQLIAKDFLGPFPESSHKNSDILVVADHFTLWTKVYASPNQEVETVA